MTKMHGILSWFVAEAGRQAAGTARNAGQAVAAQVGSTASGLANTGGELASSPTKQFKALAAELEGMAREEPRGALAGALAVRIVIEPIVLGLG